MPFASTAPGRRHVAYVDGQEGTTGLRIHEILAARADVELLRIAPDLRKDDRERARLLNAADVVFLCLPDEAARTAVQMVENPRTCVIDASTAHRTDPGWAYGLPELAHGQRDALRQASRIANPGCHATAFLLLARPLVDAGLLAPDALISATSLTGYSGGGRKMIDQYRAWHARQMDGERQIDAALSAPRPYALGLSHKHLPEMTRYARLARPPVFMPVVGNFYKGLAVSIPLHRSQLGGAGADRVQAAFEAHYAGERFISVRPMADPAILAEGSLDVQACNDTQRVDIFVFANDEQLLLVARLDNLGKGASGAAVQAMNLRLGVPEDTGLAVTADAPA